MHPHAHRRVVDDALATHCLDAMSDPEELVAAEGFFLAWVPGMPCGAHSAKLILMPWSQDPRRRALLINHERAHAWLRALKHDDYNETDCWRITVLFTFPPACRSDRRALALNPWAPFWLIELAQAGIAA